MRLVAHRIASDAVVAARLVLVLFVSIKFDLLLDLLLDDITELAAARLGRTGATVSLVARLAFGNTAVAAWYAREAKWVGSSGIFSLAEAYLTAGVGVAEEHRQRGIDEEHGTHRSKSWTRCWSAKQRQAKSAVAVSYS